MSPDHDDERRDRICRLGEEAFERLQRDQDWNSYMQMGEAFQCGREEAFFLAGTNHPNDPRYKKSFSAWLKRYPKLERFDPSDRKKLFLVMDNRGAIEVWRSTLTISERLRLNHPTSVLRKWQAATQVKANGGEPKTSPMAVMKQKVFELERQLSDANEKLAHAESGDLINWKKDKPEDMARVIIDTLSPPRLAKLMKEVEYLRTKRGVKA